MQDRFPRLQRRYELHVRKYIAFYSVFRDLGAVRQIPGSGLI